MRQTRGVSEDAATDPWAALGERFVTGQYGSLRGLSRLFHLVGRRSGA